MKTQGPTATVFPHSYAPRAGDAKPLPGNIRKIAIVGGGAAGWMTALLFAQAFIPRGVEIVVLESPAVGIIGVGEGSTPWLRGFFDGLGIEEADWMPACNATYKCGITFEGWSTKPGYTSYFHPFASMLDNLTMAQFVHNAEARLNGADVCALPNRFFLASRLAEKHMAPRPDRNFPFDVWYGYHFDAVLLGQYLHQVAEQRGVRYKPCHIEDVQLAANGDVASVRTREGETIAADFFVDCSGFAGLLVQKALATPFVSFAENLFNDAAVAMPTPIGEDIPSQTLSIAMRHGWKWVIPLTSRYGNGYVYSSSSCSQDEAEKELRASLGLLGRPHARAPPQDAHRAGHEALEPQLPRGGPVAGLHRAARGDRAPLHPAHRERVRGGAGGGGLLEKARAAYNQRINEHFEGTRDYIVTHYKTNSRNDTEYWRACSANGKLSDALKELYALWLSGRGIMEPVARQALGKGYPVLSWYSIMAGMGCFPPQLRAPTESEGRYDLEEIDNLLERSALNFRPQRELVKSIPPKVREKSLQVYFW
jgi:glycine/D-amino acid oxidase-like deaminating enzyme